MSKKSKKPAKPAAPQVKPVKRPKARRTTKPASSPVAKVPRKALQPRRTPRRAPRPVAVPEVSLSSSAPSAAAFTAAPVPPAALTVTATIDVGFGNTLFIRGQGAGLNWSSGVAMQCEADDRWSITLPTHGAVVFKFLVNDLSWSQGENYEAQAGEVIQVSPSF